MGLASALSTALTGLNAAEATIDVVGNNLANTGTAGFKASEAQFATQFLQTRSLGSAPTSNSGGTNPRQVGLGVQVAEITPDFSQGTIEVSSSPSDLAIQGDGFFIVQANGGEQLYTRNGILKTNAQNELVTISGNRLLGFGINDDFEIQSTTLQPLTIPLGSATVAQATRSVFYEGVLTPTGDIANQAEILQSAVLGDSQYAQPASGTAVQNALAPSIVGPPATAAADAGAGAGPAAGVYSYKIVYYGANGLESDASANVTTPATAGNSINLTNLPVDANYAGRNIYRNDPAALGTFKLVGTIPNQSATNFTDITTTAAWNVSTSTLTPGFIDGNYSYYVTYFNPNTGIESRPSPVIGPFNVNDDRIQLRSIPASTDTDFTSSPYTIRIYRNLANSPDQFHRVDEIPNTSPRTYVDYKSDSTIQGNPTINLDGPPINSNTPLVDILRRTGSTYQPMFSAGTLQFVGKKGGSDLIPVKEFTITSTSTAQELADFMTDAFGIQSPGDDPNNPIPNSTAPGGGTIAPGGTITNGRFQFVGNNGVGNALEIATSAIKIIPTAGSPTNPDLGFGSIQEAEGQSATSDVRVYDSLGIPLNLRVTTVLEARDSTTTTYRWFADSGDNDPQTGVKIKVGTGLIRFDGLGNVTDVTNDTVSIDRFNVASVKPLEFTLDFSELSGLASNNATLVATRQDGSAAGTLSSFIVGEDGTIRGVFTNGVTRDLGQIRLARFANPAGLEQRGENLFSSGVNSGLPIEGNPSEQGIGSIIAGATELSNTDIGKNLIDLILASTQYRGNTRVVTTSQELLDELLNLRR